MAGVTKGDFKLKLEPDGKIVFNGPFSAESKVTLKITNSDDKSRAFKVKCTSNAIFKIRPAVGFVDKGASTTVALTCKKLDADVPADNYHLFSVYHIGTKEKNARKAWQEHKGDPEGSKRLPVVFVQDKKDEKKDEKSCDKKEKEKEKDKDKEKEKEKEKEDEKKSEKKDDDKKSDKKDDEKKDDDKKSDKKEE